MAGVIYEPSFTIDSETLFILRILKVISYGFSTVDALYLDIHFYIPTDKYQ